MIEKRFEVDWVAEVRDVQRDVTRRVTGSLVMTADSIFSVMEYVGDELELEDFLNPSPVVNPHILTGSVTVGTSTYRDLGLAWPTLITYDVNDVEIVGVHELTPGNVIDMSVPHSIE